ncbi:MAG: hypothetical protein HYY06_05545 [Deltaproteobacteria bacterium]|nr:hypothetical protein [Deltaproteobacteria bacterium]
MNPVRPDEKILWVTWEDQRRNRSVSKAVGARLLEISGAGQGRLGRYVRSTVRTVGTVLRERPDFIVASNPSIVLASLALVLGRSLGRPVLIDAHNAGLDPPGGEGSLLHWVASAVTRGADVTVVHNDDLVDDVRHRGGRPFVLPDPVPDLAEAPEPVKPSAFQGKHNVLYVCTYDFDEPYLEVVEAGRLLGADVCIAITGRKVERILAANPPSNVIPTGYLPEADYVGALRAADVVMVLTTRESCAQCGAYEAVSAGVPMVLTGTATLRRIFSRGAVYTENRAAAIARAIEEAIRRRAELAAEVARLRDELVLGWNERLRGFHGILQELARRRST